MNKLDCYFAISQAELNTIADKLNVRCEGKGRNENDAQDRSLNKQESRSFVEMWAPVVRKNGKNSLYFDMTGWSQGKARRKCQVESGIYEIKPCDIVSFLNQK